MTMMNNPLRKRAIHLALVGIILSAFTACFGARQNSATDNPIANNAANADAQQVIAKAIDRLMNASSVRSHLTIVNKNGTMELHEDNYIAPDRYRVTRVNSNSPNYQESVQLGAQWYGRERKSAYMLEWRTGPNTQEFTAPPVVARLQSRSQIAQIEDCQICKIKVIGEETIESESVKTYEVTLLRSTVLYWIGSNSGHLLRLDTGPQQERITFRYLFEFEYKNDTAIDPPVMDNNAPPPVFSLRPWVKSRIQIVENGTATIAKSANQEATRIIFSGALTANFIPDYPTAHQTLSDRAERRSMTLQGTDQETGRQFAVIINFPQTLQPGTYPITKRAEVKNGGTVIYAHCQAIAPLQIFDSVGGELTLTECGEYYSGSFRLDAEDLGKKVTATGSFSKVIYTGR